MSAVLTGRVDMQEQFTRILMEMDSVILLYRWLLLQPVTLWAMFQTIRIVMITTSPFRIAHVQ